jgi:transposase
MYIAEVPNRNSPPAILLRESFRENGKVRNRTIANLSHWPPTKIAALRSALKGESPAASLADSFDITRSRPHGHCAAVLATIDRLGLAGLLDSSDGRHRRAALALIASRILDPGSKLATHRALRTETCHSTLGESLGLDHVQEDDLYAAMDWLVERQSAIESQLARRHLREGTLVLYDLTSTYFEGRHCPLAKLGCSRDERRANPQIVFGLLSDPEGCPVAVEVFEGNTGDPKTVATQVNKLRQRFHLERVVLVGDRGMLTQKRIEEDLRAHEGLEWVSALRAPQIQKLVAQGALQMSLFDQQDLAEVQHPDYPGERLIVCRNPLLAAERVRKRGELIAAAEKKLGEIASATRRKRQPLRGEDKIGYLIGKALASSKVDKYFRWHVASGELHWERNQARIDIDAALDGIYVLRTNVPAGQLDRDQTVLAYKRLAQVERAFRSLKSVDLHVRPIHHRLEKRVRAHILIAMLAYYVEWHMRRVLAPVLFDDEQRGAPRTSPVAPARRSTHALAKARAQRTEDNWTVQSFRDWMEDLATIAKNRIQPKLATLPAFDITTRPTAPQQHALDLLSVKL